MNRTFTLDSWREFRAGTMPAVAKLAQKRRIRGRSRTPEERAMIQRMAIAAVEQRRREGRLVQVGPREYVYHIKPRSGASGT